MKFCAAFALLTLAIVAVNAVPAPEEAAPLHHLVERACLPASCSSYGCCSGGCPSWCRQCNIPFKC
ncbi:hypothetical protein INT45_007951 [Circinella minor]|uniref:Uncharacterized protein n=1 Tax=Circinella minor TaxID=1195481 RepID=A0A8H7VIR5_9FUNG|nr:hypothetical protein INT45_007951 [Circinella minor]